jgi:hypothetical protein
VSFCGLRLLCSSVTICSEIAGTELKSIAAEELVQLREFSRGQGPASTPAAVVTAVIAIARVVGIHALILALPSADDVPRIEFPQLLGVCP